MDADELVLGVDGGGTKTVAWLARANGDSAVPVGSGEAGPTNPGVVGPERALTALGHAIDAAFAELAIPPRRVAAACLAVSGSEQSSWRDAMLQWAADRELASRVQLINDAEAVLAAGSPSGWGIALIAGTGSFAFGRNLHGQTARVGGWGYLFGDEGSGHALGTAGLRAAAHDADGRGPTTRLLPRLLSHFDLREPRELVARFYREAGDQHKFIAGLAPLVTAAAAEGDEVAMRLARDAAQDLANLVVATCGQLQLAPATFPLGIAGGVLCNSELMHAYFKSELAAHNHATTCITSVHHPVQGAVILAQRDGV